VRRHGRVVTDRHGTPKTTRSQHEYDQHRGTHRRCVHRPTTWRFSGGAERRPLQARVGPTAHQADTARGTKRFNLPDT
jgi:hypothetical protein